MRYGDFEKLTPLYKLEQLRTLLPTCIDLDNCYPLSKRVQHNILPSLRSLRILSLSHYQIVELSNDLFIELKLLRFLDLSQTDIKKLPDSICVLYNLETLLLLHCSILEDLPLQMEKLINLHHFDISNTYRLKMPLHLSKLKSLQVLVGVKFLLGGGGGSRMEDLGEVHNLYGSLSILELQNVVDRREDRKAKMSILPSTLKTVRISRCQKLKLEQPVCDSIDDISPELLRRARKLRVLHCPNLTSFLIPTATESLHIWNCENLEITSVACSGTQMAYLCIFNCKKLKWLPERMQQLLPSLKTLNLWHCPEILSFPEGELPFNLQVLEICNCTKLVNGRKVWCLQKLPCLRELVIAHDGSDEEMEHSELPSSIQRLTIRNLKTLSSQVFESLTSLEYLYMADLPQIQSMLEQGRLPSSLYELHLSRHHVLRSLPESALSSSLSELIIEDCLILQFLPVKEMPSSLSKLTIRDCPYLKSLPVKGMPPSLSELYVPDFPLLKPLLEFDKGEYWPEIAHISNIEIDW
uniref:Disease resistance protein I2C-5 n=1 Tax=Solanum tuberosum TaxID=4113 RepID=M1DLT0_SOLTU